MLGSIIGDIVGSIYEFSNINTKDFPFWGEGVSYTDDSILSIATADWLLHDPNGCMSPADYYLNYAKRYPSPMGGYGTGFLSWVNKSIQNHPAQAYNSCGNGSAMRVGPIGHLQNDIETLLEIAAKSAACTHNHPEGIKGAQAVVFAMALAMRNSSPKDSIRHEIEQRFGYDLSFDIATLQRRYSWDGLNGNNGATCQGSVPEAIVCALEAISFEDAIRNAVSIGGDSDTIACITGSIAELLYGIPVDIYEKGLSYLPQELRDLVLEFEGLFGNHIKSAVIDVSNPIIIQQSLNHINMPITHSNMQEPILHEPEAQITIAEGIQEIINQRKGLGPYEGHGYLAKIETCRSFFTNLKNKVLEYDTFWHNLIAQEEAKAGEYYSYFTDDPTLVDRVKKASAKTVLDKLDLCIAECNRLYSRFNRDTINISVIGLARQGKSCLLQAISGLENSVIPTSNGGDCTGTTSIICNEPGTTRAHAEVVFYNASEMVDIVRKYIESIGLNCAVGSFNGLPLLISIIHQYDEGQLPDFNAKQKALFLHFRKYIEHFDDYQHLVQVGSISVAENEIRQYVAQHDEQQHATYQYLAVKEVRIYKEFNYAEAGRIQLVDTIGLGDTSLGIEEKMLDTLHNNSDASFWIKLPASTGDHWGEAEVDLYDKIAKAMGTEMLDKWLYIVLNRRISNDPDNDNAVSTQSVNDDIARLHLHKAGVIVVNCASTEQVQEKLILPTLQSLAANLHDVDNDLIQKATTLFDNCYSAYSSLYEKAQNIIIGSPKAKAGLDMFAIEKWDIIKDEISAAIGQLYISYRESESNPSDKIVKAIAKCRDNIHDLMPKLEWYEKKLMVMGQDADAESVYKDGLHEVRTRISANFEDINYNVLIPMQDTLKEKVAEILFNTGHWKVLYLLTESAGTPSIKWLSAFSQEKLKEYPALQATIEYILSYRMSISDLLDYEVEKSLGILTPDSRQYEQLDLGEIRRQGADLSIKALAQYISNTTTNRISKVKKELKQADFTITKVPNHSLYARIRKFREKLIMTNTIQDELRRFYITNAASFWSAEYRQATDNQKAFEELLQWIGKLSMEGSTIEDFKLNI